MDKGTGLQPFADIQKTDPLRPVQLMGAGAEHIDLILVHVDGELSIGLHRIRMEQDPMLLRDPADLLYRLDGSDLVIGKHDGNENGIRTDGPLQLVQLQDAVLVHAHICDLKSSFLQIFAGVKHRVMLNGGGDDMLSLLRISLGSCLDGPVVALRSPRGKIDLIVRRAEAFGDDFPNPVHGLLAFRPQRINAARISVMLRKIREHGLHHLRRRPCGRRIVQIDQLLHLSSPFLFPILKTRPSPALPRRVLIPTKSLRFTDVTIPLPIRSVNRRFRIYFPKRLSR